MIKEVREKLLRTAKGYEECELNSFLAEVGWEDWMCDYIDDYNECLLDGETPVDYDDLEIPDEVCRKIDEDLKEIFAEAHEED